MRIFNREFSGYALVGILAGVYLAFAMVTGFVTTGHNTAIASESAGEHAVAAEEQAAAAEHHAVEASKQAEALHEMEAEEHEGFGEGEPAEHGGHGGHGEHHGITHSQVMNFIWHCLNFSILAIVLVKYLRKPISDGLRGRTEQIQARFDELEAKRQEAEKKYAEYERKLSGLEDEAKRILTTFVEQGQSEKEKIITQAHEAAERIKAQAEFYVQQELAKARVALQKEMADSAVEAAEELIRKNLTEQDHHQLISEYLERVVQKN